VTASAPQVFVMFKGRDNEKSVIPKKYACAFWYPFPTGGRNKLTDAAAKITETET